MNPGDFDDDNEGLSFNDLPPSVRARAVQAQAAARQPQAPPQPVMPQQAVQPPMPQVPVYYPQQPQPPRYALAQVPVPIEQAQQAAMYQLAPGQMPMLTPPPAPEPKDNSSWLFLGATVLLAGVGWWAYSKMEKDKRRIRVGPARAAYEDDGDYSGSDEDAGDSGAPLDEYEGAGLDPKDVDPHEDGGIKMVRG